jgi:hypothetical protein
MLRERLAQQGLGLPPIACAGALDNGVIDFAVMPFAGFTHVSNAFSSRVAIVSSSSE